MSDPVDGRFRVLATDDGGRSWRMLPSEGMPTAVGGDFEHEGVGVEASARARDGAHWVGGGDPDGCRSGADLARVSRHGRHGRHAVTPTRRVRTARRPRLLDATGPPRAEGVQWVVATLVGLSLLAGCTSGPARPTAHHAPATRPAPSDVKGCGGTVLRRGHPPPWTADANPPTFLRYVVSDQATLVGFLFGDPLYAGRVPPTAPGNKVLWIARYPRNGQPLEVTLSKPGSKRRPNGEFPANSGPGEIYPSHVHAPSPGCWHVVAVWGRHRATLDLPFVSAG